MRQDLVAVGQSTPHPGGTAPLSQFGLAWRHAATALLLALVIPVLLVAGAAALLVLPLVVAVVGVEQARQLSQSLRPTLPARAPR